MHGPRSGRALAVALAGSVAAVTALAVFVRVVAGSWALAHDAGTPDPADVLLVGIGGLGALGCLWLGVATTAAALAELPGVLGSVGARLAGVIAPAVVRRVVAVAAGTALAASVAPASACAYAAPAGARHTAVATLGNPPDPSLRPLAETPLPPSSTAGQTGPTATSTTPVSTAPGTTAPKATTPNATAPSSTTPSTSAPDPGFVPAAPPAPAPTATGIDTLERTPRPTTGAASVHVVRRGDTLWDIAAAHLGPGATPADIAAAWPRWYAVNRAVIGPDPGHIVPGQRLVAPATGAGRTAAFPVTASQGGAR